MAAGDEAICVVIGRTRHKMVQIEIQEAAKQGARLIELRLDYLAKAPDFGRLLANKPCPMVATVRRISDGGKWNGAEDARRTLLRQAIVAGFDWVDLETDVADAIPRYKDVQRIVSYHNTREVPATLDEIHAKLCRQDADVVKLAVRAHNQADNLRVFNLLKNAKKPTVAICMGDMGVASRVLGPLYGTPFTYAAFNKERGIAPGLLSFAELKHVYHYEHINPETRVYGVIGDPVAHSLGPHLHNAVFRRIGINAVYLPFRVPRSDLQAFLEQFERIPVHGYSVTIPHKEAVAELVKHREEMVEHTHSANTLIRSENGGFTAYNTDYQAVLDTLRAELPRSQDGEPPVLESKVVLVLGAGGMARTVAHALHRQRALVTIVSRTLERSQKLAAEVGCRQAEWEARHGLMADIVINCTPVGMHPDVDESPMHHSYFKPGLTAFDAVYTPETTLFIKEARARGCHTITGVDLFVRQAALQFELFAGVQAPVDKMRLVLRRLLSPVTIKPTEELPGGEAPSTGIREAP
jgi:3-dehydroquinate dehydratase / shikimate dehydrogenase